MNKTKILTVVGARPQFIKAAVISRLLSSDFKHVDEVVVHTGQHYDDNMSAIFFKDLEIPQPKYFLNINNLSHGSMIGTMIIELEKIILKEQPNCLLIYGDTNSTLAAGIAGKKLGIKIAHIESGVRNYDENMPEESNRYLVDRLSDFNFCCTKLGYQNLISEGFSLKNMNRKFFLSGDIMFDAALYESKKNKNLSETASKIISQYDDYILTTIHRASNTDSFEALSSIIDSLNRINEYSKIVMLIHPRTKAKLREYNIKVKFTLFEPLGYHDTLKLLIHSSLVITDSGGLVREAYFFKKKSIFLLSKHVWPEITYTGASINIDPIKRDILKVFKALKSKRIKWDANIFGKGAAGKKILNKLLKEIT